MRAHAVLRCVCVVRLGVNKETCKRSLSSWRLLLSQAILCDHNSNQKCSPNSVRASVVSCSVSTCHGTVLYVKCTFYKPAQRASCSSARCNDCRSRPLEQPNPDITMLSCSMQHRVCRLSTCLQLRYVPALQVHSGKALPPWSACWLSQAHLHNPLSPQTCVASLRQTRRAAAQGRSCLAPTAPADCAHLAAECWHCPSGLHCSVQPARADSSGRTARTWTFLSSAAQQGCTCTMNSRLQCSSCTEFSALQLRRPALA
jgi:hypothetical protein